jgi:hypothetical protein
VAWKTAGEGGGQSLTGLEEKNGNLPEVEIDEMLRLVCYVAAKVAANDAVPGWIVLLVKLLLDVSRYVLFNVILLECLRRTVDGILLHVLRHVGILDDGLAISHYATVTINERRQGIRSSRSTTTANETR